MMKRSIVSCTGVLCVCVTVFVGGCGDAGDIDPNAPPVAMEPPGDMGAPGPTEPPDGPLEPPGDMEPPDGMDGAAGVVINEISPAASQIELHNRGSSRADISGFWLCHSTPGLIYARMPNGTVIEPGGFLIVHWGIRGSNTAKEIFTFPAVPIPMNVPDGEIGFFTSFGFDEANFGKSEFIRDYVQWGEGGHFREPVAVGAGIWPPGGFVPAPGPGQSLSFDGTADNPTAWTATAPTIGSNNSFP